MSDLLQGEDRIALWKVADRPLRMGSPNTLAVGDLDRVRQFFRLGPADARDEWLDYVTASHVATLAASAEWVLTWPEALSRVLPAGETPKTVERVLTAWKDAQRDGGDPVFQQIAACFTAAVLIPEAAAGFRQYASAGQTSPLVTALMHGSQVLLDGMDALLDRGKTTEAAVEFERYWTDMRQRHDYLSQLLWAFAGLTSAWHGQAIAEQAQQASYMACSWFEPLWGPVGKLTPAELAAMLADQLRNHFSGPDRSASVEIVEDDDCFRLILQPCGSGGAMRRLSRERMPADFGRFAEATPFTWHRQDEVPACCSGCALNEVTSVKRLGYPAWVTEFNPNPSRPCGWTVYKSPDRIPESYFERVGVKKDPGRFGKGFK